MSTNSLFMVVSGSIVGCGPPQTIGIFGFFSLMNFAASRAFPIMLPDMVDIPTQRN